MDALRIISEDHNNLWRLATTVDQLAGELEAGAALDSAFFGSVFDYFEQFVERSHHPKEDEHLFRLLRLRSPQAAATLDDLQAAPYKACLLYTSPSPRDGLLSRMPSSA